MVAFAFIFLAVILLMPILLVVLVFDFVSIYFKPALRVRRGFEVIPAAETVKKP